MSDYLLCGGVLEQQLHSLPADKALSWHDIIALEFARDKAKYMGLDEMLTELYATGSVNPQKENIFRAFKECPFGKTSVVILGQDPYPNKEHAVGLAFSVPDGCKQPPSLKNILAELESDIGPNIQVRSGDFSSWARQGVLLLNTALTVEEGNSNSHKALWDGFATNVLSFLNSHNKNPIIFILWGKQAHKIGSFLEQSVPEGYRRKFIYGVHPSPLSAYRGFFGSKPFSKTNCWLIANGYDPIQW